MNVKIFGEEDTFLAFEVALGFLLAFPWFFVLFYLCAYARHPDSPATLHWASARTMGAKFSLSLTAGWEWSSHLTMMTGVMLAMQHLCVSQIPVVKCSVKPESPNQLVLFDGRQVWFGQTALNSSGFGLKPADSRESLMSRESLST